MPTEGTMILHFLGEDQIMRGERERPGHPFGRLRRESTSSLTALDGRESGAEDCVG
jgi:hypothetical protein